MMHRLVEAHGVALPLRLDAALIRVKRRKPLGEYEAWWPFVTMQTWCHFLLLDYPHMLLAGHDLADSEAWQSDFREFWDKYRNVNPSHPIYSSDLDLGHCCPYAFHGDEGRGSARDPFLVCSFQPILSHLGLSFCNDSSCLGPMIDPLSILCMRHSFTTRLLLSCIASKMYLNSTTTDDLFAEIARQARECILEGVEVA